MVKYGGSNMELHFTRLSTFNNCPPSFFPKTLTSLLPSLCAVSLAFPQVVLCPILFLNVLEYSVFTTLPDWVFGSNHSWLHYLEIGDWGHFLKEPHDEKCHLVFPSLGALNWALSMVWITHAFGSINKHFSFRGYMQYMSLETAINWTWDYPSMEYKVSYIRSPRISGLTVYSGLYIPQRDAPSINIHIKGWEDC